MSGRLIAMFVLAGRAAAALPVGWACPIPRAMHAKNDDPSTRAARDQSAWPPECCGVIVNGTAFSARGVVCWPVLENDRVESQSWAVVMVLFDGSRIYLSEASGIVLDAPARAVRILRGAVSWKLGSSSQRHILALRQIVDARAGMAELRDGQFRLATKAPFPNFAPDPAELLQRFPYAAGRLIPADQP